MKLIGSENFGSLHVEAFSSSNGGEPTLYQFRNQTGSKSLCTEGELRRVRDHLTSLLSKPDHVREKQISKPDRAPPRVRQRSRG